MSALSHPSIGGWTPEKPYVHVHVQAEDLPAVRAIFDLARIGVHYTRAVIYVVNRPEAAPHLDTFVFAFRLDWPQPRHAPNLDELVVRLLHDADIQAMVSGQKVGD